MNRVQQFALLKRFGQKFHRARFHRPRSHGNVTVSRDKNDRNANAALLELGLSGRTALTNSSVEPNDSERSPTDFNKLFTAARIEASSSTTNTTDSVCVVGIYDSIGIVN